MNFRKALVPFVISFLILGASQNVIAAKIFQWSDEEGSVHFSNVLPKVTPTIIAYKSSTAGKTYQWTDEEGGIHFSDIPPVDGLTIEMREIKIDNFDSNTIDPEKYSIVNQVERMAERRKQIEEERLSRKRLKLEKYRMAQEIEIIRLNEQIRTQGYGPRPYYTPYSQQYNYHKPQDTYYQSSYTY